MNLAFKISDDIELFGTLNDRARRIVHARLRVLANVHDLVMAGHSVSGACRSAAASYGAARGFSPERLNDLYVQFRAAGDWKILVDRAVAGPRWQSSLGAKNVPDAAMDYFAEQWVLNQRDKFRTVYGRILKQLERWRAGDESQRIPGYDSPPAAADGSLTGLPPGWTYGNLKTAVNKRASKFTRKLVQRGPKDASQHGPMILSTRAGTEVGQFTIIDDEKEDFKVIAFGQSCELWGYHALDLCAGKNIMAGFKPAFRLTEDGVKHHLREREVIWLLVAKYTNIGYRAAGETIICEKSSATVREREEAILRDFGLPIKVQRGPAGGGPGINALFTGPGAGNPRWKAPLESWFNLLRNHTAGLLDFPGQTGSYSSGLPSPEGLPGLERDALAILKLAKTLPPDRAQKMRMGMFNFIEAINRLHDLIDLINLRTDHDLEGWRKLGNFVSEWRPSKIVPWLPEEKLLQLQNGEAAAVAAVLSLDPALKRERPLSPTEAFERGLRSVPHRKMPLAVAAMLMAEIEGAECPPVKNGVVSVECPELDPDEPLRYGLTRRDGNGTEEPLRNDERYMTRVNHVDPRQVWLYGANGEFKGVARRYDRVGRTDEKALHRAFAAKRQYLAPQIADARRLAGAVTRAAIARDENNLDAMSSRLHPQADSTAEFLARENAPIETED
ncbi:MAG: hypothetical protein KGL39_13210 [Patescibacteria group bacterium]|nr:hypothetical protein [Patescibacteria group bacterium]